MIHCASTSLICTATLGHEARGGRGEGSFGWGIFSSGTKVSTISFSPGSHHLIVGESVHVVERTCEAAKEKLFSRDVQVSAPVREYFCSEERSRAEQEAFADLLLKLDADPVSHTSAILDPPIPGMRWAKLGRRKVIVHFDPSHDRVKVVLIE